MRYPRARLIARFVLSIVSIATAMTARGARADENPQLAQISGCLDAFELRFKDSTFEYTQWEALDLPEEFGSNLIACHSSAAPDLLEDPRSASSLYSSIATFYDTLPTTSRVFVRRGRTTQRGDRVLSIQETGPIVRGHRDALDTPAPPSYTRAIQRLRSQGGEVEFRPASHVGAGWQGLAQAYPRGSAYYITDMWTLLSWLHRPRAFYDHPHAVLSAQQADGRWSIRFKPSASRPDFEVTIMTCSGLAGPPALYQSTKAGVLEYSVRYTYREDASGPLPFACSEVNYIEGKVRIRSTIATHTHFGAAASEPPLRLSIPKHAMSFYHADVGRNASTCEAHVSAHDWMSNLVTLLDEAPPIEPPSTPPPMGEDDHPHDNPWPIGPAATILGLLAVAFAVALVVVRKRRRSAARVRCWIAVLCLGSLGATGCSRSDPERLIDLGEVKPGVHAVTATISLTNPFPTPAKITRIDKTCSCIMPQRHVGSVIPASTSLDIPVNLVVRPLVGTFEERVAFRTEANGDERVARYLLRGTVPVQLDIRPAYLRLLPHTALNGAFRHTATLYCSKADYVSHVQLVSAPEGARVVVGGRRTTEFGDEYAIQIEFHGDLAVLTTNHKVRLKCERVGSEPAELDLSILPPEAAVDSNGAGMRLTFGASDPPGLVRVIDVPSTSAANPGRKWDIERTPEGIDVSVESTSSPGVLVRVRAVRRGAGASVGSIVLSDGELRVTLPTVAARFRDPETGPR